MDLSISFIPYGRQTIDEEDVEAVVRVLRSDFLTQGPETPSFENLVASSLGVPHAVAANSATSALHIALLAMGVGAGDEVWVPAITFVASSNAALYCGASVNFIDIDPATFNLSLEDLEVKLAQAKNEHRIPKVVIAVHLGGAPCELSRLKELSNTYGFFIVEDASHAVGATYEGFEIGTCKYSDVAVFSFHPVKIVTSGEGGMATTNSDELAQRMAQFRSHGITREFDQFEDKRQGSWHYEQQRLGYNYRLPEISAVLGRSQFQKRHEFIAIRKTISERYRKLMPDASFQTQLPNSTSAHHLEIMLVPNEEKRSLFEHLKSHGIGVNVHYAPVFTQPYYKSLRKDWGHFPNAIEYYKKAISLPIYPLLDEGAQEQVVNLIKGHKGSQVIF